MCGWIGFNYITGPSGISVKCRGGMVFFNCGMDCTRTCEEPNPRCNRRCVQKCQCPRHVPIWDGYKCITVDQCAPTIPKCPGNLVWNGKGNGCSKACGYEDPKLCYRDEYSKCECPSNRPYLTGNHKCVTYQDCLDTSNPDSRCSGELVWNNCASPCDRTCENRNPEGCAGCVPKCECPSDRPYYHDGRCHKDYECPIIDPPCVFGPKPIWNQCGSACEKTCDNPNPVCTADCVAKCECPPQRPIFHKNQCITLAECPTRPTDPQKCVNGMVWNNCGSACNATCDDRKPPCIRLCVARCECPRNKPILHNGQCIEEFSCPVVDPPCFWDKVWNFCGSACDRTCDDPNPICTEQCVQKCECPGNRPILHQDRCITQAECPTTDPVCYGGTVWSGDCARNYELTCEFPDPPLHITRECRPGKCQCPNNRPILLNGQCITKAECPAQCSGGMVRVGPGLCGRNYVLTCENPTPPQIVTRECRQGICECPDSRPILHNGRCITTAECPTPCSGGMVRVDHGQCGRNYVLTCENPTPPQAITYECRQRICECPDSRPILHNGQCVTTAECPVPCSGGMVRVGHGQCGRNYVLTCENPTPPQAITYECRQGICECPDSRPILHNGQCVTTAQCPAQCFGGMVRVGPGLCGRNYVLTCENQTPPLAITTECRQGICECPDSRPILHNGQCITTTECPAQCSGGMVQVGPFQCGRNFVLTCENPTPPQITTLECRQGICECPDSRPILHNAQCITTAECPDPEPTCQGDLVWNYCGSACARTCEDPNPACTRQCVQKCECPADKPIQIANDKCATQNKCSTTEPTCQGDLVWNYCGSACARTCEDPNPVCTRQCVQKCECPADKPIQIANDKCATQDKCSTTGCKSSIRFACAFSCLVRGMIPLANTACNSCQCVHVCSGHQCPAGSRCAAQIVQCVKFPCFPQPKCVPEKKYKKSIQY